MCVICYFFSLAFTQCRWRRAHLWHYFLLEMIENSLTFCFAEQILSVFPREKWCMLSPLVNKMWTAYSRPVVVHMFDSVTAAWFKNWFVTEEMLWFRLHIEGRWEQHAILEPYNISSELTFFLPLPVPLISVSHVTNYSLLETHGCLQLHLKNSFRVTKLSIGTRFCVENDFLIKSNSNFWIGQFMYNGCLS